MYSRCNMIMMCQLTVFNSMILGLIPMAIQKFLFKKKEIFFLYFFFFTFVHNIRDFNLTQNTTFRKLDNVFETKFCNQN